MYKLKNTVIVLFLIILVNGSCKNIFRKDHSLTLKEYQAKGMPDINIAWPQSKLMEAYNTLLICKNKKLPVTAQERQQEIRSCLQPVIKQGKLVLY